MSDGDLSFHVLLDENVDRQVLSYLRTEGHSGAHVVDVLEPGADDEDDIAPYARERDLIVVTKDTDFLSIDSSEHAGVFFVSDHGLSAYEIATGIIWIAETLPDREQCRDVIFVDSWTEGPEIW